MLHLWRFAVEQFDQHRSPGIAEHYQLVDGGALGWQ